ETGERVSNHSPGNIAATPLVKQRERRRDPDDATDPEHAGNQALDPIPAADLEHACRLDIAVALEVAEPCSGGAYSVAHHPRPTRRRGIRPRGLRWVRGQEGVPEARAHLQWHTVFTDEHPRGIRRAHRCDPRMLSGSDNTPTRKPSRRRFGVDRGGVRRYY